MCLYLYKKFEESVNFTEHSTNFADKRRIRKTNHVLLCLWSRHGYLMVLTAQNTAKIVNQIPT